MAAKKGSVKPTYPRLTLRRDPFRPPSGPRPAVRRLVDTSETTRVAKRRNQQARSDAAKKRARAAMKKKPLVKKAGRQRRRGATRRAG